MVLHGNYRLIADVLARSMRNAQTALGWATAVLLGAHAENGMKAAEYALHELRREIEELPITPLAPAKRSDIPATVAVVHLGGDLERLAELTQQIAEIAWSRHSKQPFPSNLQSAMATMSGCVLALIERAGETATLESAAVMSASARLERDLARVEGQQRLLDKVLLAADPPVDDSIAVDLALLGRCYETCARHAVSAARRIAVLPS